MRPNFRFMLIDGGPLSQRFIRDASALEAQLLNSVQFVQQIENIYAQGGYCFVEIGPRQILTNLVKQILGDRPHLAIALNPSGKRTVIFNCHKE